MNRSLIHATLAAAALTVPAANVDADIIRVVERFNIQAGDHPTHGWTFGGLTEVRERNGNPYLYGEVDTFGVALQTTGPDDNPWVGDMNYRAEGVVGFQITTAGTTDFNSVRPLGIALINDNGTPDDFSDDFGYYHMTGATYDFDGTIRAFRFPVPSQHTGSDPKGWNQYTFGDVPPFTWDDVITDVDRIEFLYYDPEFFYIFQFHYLGVDNITAFIDTDLR